jgi:hypothetical protein
MRAVDSYSGHITHRDGPSGPRAALIGGPDVWEVISTEPDVPGRAPRVGAVAEYLGLTVEQVAVAFGYYDDHRAEVDARVTANRHAADEGHTGWLRRKSSSHR